MYSDDDRTTKKLIQHQKEYMINGSWYGELMIISKEYEIELNNSMLKIKSKWKQYVKNKIKNKIVAESEEKRSSMPKLRHQKQQEFCMQQYIKETNIVRIQDLIRVKLELLDIGKNQGQADRQCYACKKEDETSEHIISCSKIYEITETTDIIEWNNETMSDRSQLNISCRDNEK